MELLAEIAEYEKALVNLGVEITIEENSQYAEEDLHSKTREDNKIPLHEIRRDEA